MRPSRALFVSMLTMTACQAPSLRGPDQTTAIVEATAVRSQAIAVDAVDDAQIAESDAADERLVRAALHDLAIQRRTVLDNLANANTPGYKRKVIASRHTAMRGSGDNPVPVRPGQEFFSVFSQGPLLETNRALDFAIDGDGFFALSMPDGTTAYTRNSSWHVNADGKLVTREGWILLPEITVPQDTLELSIDPRGACGGRTAGSPDCTTLFGALTLHRFVNPEGLRAVGNVWAPSEESGQPISGVPGLAGLGVLKQGHVECSNVVLETEQATLQGIDRQRRALSQMLQKPANGAH